MKVKKKKALKKLTVEKLIEYRSKVESKFDRYLHKLDKLAQFKFVKGLGKNATIDQFENEEQQVLHTKIFKLNKEKT